MKENIIGRELEIESLKTIFQVVNLNLLLSMVDDV